MNAKRFDARRGSFAVPSTNAPGRAARRARAMRAIVGSMQIAQAFGRLKPDPTEEGFSLVDITVSPENRDAFAAAAIEIGAAGFADIRKLPPTCGGLLQLSFDTDDLPTLRRAVGIRPQPGDPKP